MDLQKKHLKNCSPYILELNYNLEKRELTAIFARDTVNWTPGRRIIFPEILSFSETLFEDASDKELIDSVMGFHETYDGRICLSTEKRELILRLAKAPFSEDIV